MDKKTFHEDDKLAILAATLLVDAMEEAEGSKLPFRLDPLKAEKLMRVSANTLEGLHIFGPHSLFSFLNQTKTPGGDRLLQIWLRQPLRDPEDIQAR